MTQMKRKKQKKIERQLVEIYKILESTYGPQICPLNHKSPFQLLVATILSAQCTDVRVNLVTKNLFERFPGPDNFASAKLPEIEKLIKPAGLYRMKALNIQKSSKRIIESYNGRVPSDMESLTTLPGVGRKTANVVLGNAFGIPGFPVDTHVTRVLNRLEIVKSQSPVEIEKVLIANCPDEVWTDFSHLIITHGRARCKARKADCPNCELRTLCAYGKIHGNKDV